MNGVGRTSPEVCHAIRSLHEAGFIPLVIDNMLMVRAWPARPVPVELVALVVAHGQDIAQYLLESSK